MGSATQILNSEATHIRAQTGIDAARKTQASGNARRAAEASAQNIGKSLGNRRIMEGAGDQIGAINENIVRNLDASVSGTISQRIQASEELGTLVADAAASGIGGSSVDIFKATVGLSNAFAEERQANAVSSDVYAASASKGDVLRNSVASLDNTASLASLDFTQFVDHHKMSDTSKLLAFTGAASATVYGGPQAGFAVLDAFQAREDTRNGDFAGAQLKTDRAVMGAAKGWETYTSGAGKGKVGEAWATSIWNSTKAIRDKIKIG